MMTTPRSFAIIFVLAFALAGIANAQKTSSKRPVPRPTPVRSTLPPLDVRAARVKVANQYSNVLQFQKKIDLFATAIDALENEARTRKIAKASADANEKNKQALMASIKDMRAGIDALETEFETKPALKLYLVRLQGISDLAAQSENLAFSGKYLASRAPWATIAQRLNDTLKAMPNVEL